MIRRVFLGVGKVTEFIVIWLGWNAVIALLILGPLLLLSL